MKRLMYGTAYYDEYMPYDRLDRDVEMMQKAGINTVRIAESTWATCEPEPGVFDFSHVTRVMDAMEKAGIDVIIGTPTYAIPSWMERICPDVIATTRQGKGIYGARQIMDITHPAYRYYAERVIRRLCACTAERKCVIGYQLDNETKYYDTAGPNVQQGFVRYLEKKFDGNIDRLNDAFGLNYWSNRISSWEDFPDVRGTINGSLAAEFDRYRRSLVDEFLQWQADIVSEYKREDQFLTHNFDFDWRGWSYGVQPMVNHFHAVRALTVAGCDIYHPTQDHLTGKEIAFGGDLIRSLRHDNYLVMETEAQGFPCWTPYPGQIRLQAFSHLASGANGVEYWHWHSIHNSFETYWKGILSHDFAENEVYREVATVGADFRRVGEHLVNLRKTNRVAMLVSNEALTALEYFPIDVGSAEMGKTHYNDIVRWMYDALYEMNIGCDFLSPDAGLADMKAYDMILVPALYAAPDALLTALKEYAEEGGTLVVTFKSGFANEEVKVSTDVQPHILGDAAGVTYHEFTFPEHTGLRGILPDEMQVAGGAQEGDSAAQTFMELLIPGDGCRVLASYDHPYWSAYAAITENSCGKGTVYYLGCGTSPALLKALYRRAAAAAGIGVPEISFPVIVRGGTNDFGKRITYYLNYSGKEQQVPAREAGTELITGKSIGEKETLVLAPWGFAVEESL